MTSPIPSSSIIPAHLNFLAIYNPSLGPTDETFADQLVFYYSRAAHEARVAARKRSGRYDALPTDGAREGDGAREEKQDREEQNEQLRQIGLAQGMVDFAK